MAKVKDSLRLDKALARAFEMSRSQAASFIKQGLVLVDGTVVKDAGFKVSLDTIISLDDNDFTADQTLKKRVFMLNKPQDFVCADRDKRYRTVVSLFSDEMHYTELHCVGRLDADTVGLILVTDDGDLSHRVTSPKSEIEKCYLAVVKNPLSNRDIERFAKGLKHAQEDKPYKSAKLEIIEPTIAKVTITEGRYHEVKRLFECVENEVLSLKRLSIGKLVLHDDLEEGEYRALTEDDIALIFAKCP